MDTFSGLMLSILFGVLPMLFFAWLIYWADRYEKEPLFLVGPVFLWGAIVAAGGAFLINTIFGLGVYLFTGSEAATEFTTGSLVAPVVEESLKGLAVLTIFLLFRHEFDSILDGIVYAAIAALGFAATENAYYIFTYGFTENGVNGLIWMVFVRIIMVGWQHPFYTAFTGIGLAISRLSRNTFVKVTAPVGGWVMAVFTHSIHNTISILISGTWGIATTALFDWTGWFLMFLFILWAIYRERSWIVQQLRDEVSQGVITVGQYHSACSAWGQGMARLRSLSAGNYRQTNRFYQLTAELAYKKQQRASLGEENGNTEAIQKLQAELSKLSTHVVN